MDMDLRWIGGIMYRNGEIEETGLAAGVLGHPALGVAWLANKLGQLGVTLEAGHLVLSGSFTRVGWAAEGRPPARAFRAARRGRDFSLFDAAARNGSGLDAPTLNMGWNETMELSRNVFKQALKERRLQIGLWSSLASNIGAEIIADFRFRLDFARHRTFAQRSPGPALATAGAGARHCDPGSFGPPGATPC